jgi:hypothetical protein
MATQQEEQVVHIAQTIALAHTLIMEPMVLEDTDLSVPATMRQVEVKE